MIKSMTHRGLLEGFGIVTIVVFVAGLPPACGIADETARAQTPRNDTRCEVKSVIYSSDGTKIAAFVMNGRDSGNSDTRPYNVSNFIALLNSDDLSNVATIPLDHIEVEDRTGLPAWYKSVVFSGDGKSLYVIDPKLWQIRTWNIASSVWSADYPIHVAAFGFVLSRNSGWLAAAVAPTGVRIWDTNSGRQLLHRTDWGPPPQWALPEFDSDGKRFAVVTARGVEVWNVDPTKLLSTLAEPIGIKQSSPSTNIVVTRLAWSFDGKTLAVGRTKGVHLYYAPAPILKADSPDQTNTKQKNGQTAASFDYRSTNREIAFSPDGRALALVDTDGIRFFDVTNNYENTRTISNSGILCLAFARKGDTYAVGDMSGKLTIRDAATGKELRSTRFDR